MLLNYLPIAVTAATKKIRPRDCLSGEEPIGAITADENYEEDPPPCHTMGPYKDDGTTCAIVYCVGAPTSVMIAKSSGKIHVQMAHD